MIINSLLQTDFYKFTQQQVALHQFPSTQVKYKFKCRNKANWTEHHLVRLREEIKHYCNLKFTEDELSYLSNIKFFKKSYIDFLRLYQPNINHIKAKLKNGQLSIEAEGPWFLTILFEVPILSMVNEIYFEETYADYELAIEKLKEKCEIANKNELPFVDFGTRRRFSSSWHNKVVKYLKENANTFKGTSNVYLAKKYDLTPIGTMAHELMQVGQAIGVQLKDSQKKMLQVWVEEYRGNLGIALTDVISMDAFLNDFDLYFAKLYDGLRHDSGDPYDWAEKAIGHYNRLGINPKTKTLVFSDGLNFISAPKLHHAFKNRIQTSFGIGTNLTNNIDGITPLQVVMKVIECNDQPVAKISDSPGKNCCEDPKYIDYLKKVFNA